MRFVLCLLFSFFLACGCTPSDGYRQKPQDTVERLSPRIALGHVEIDDQGELISYDQLLRVTARIRAESKEPLLLLIYIHGWNHNASRRWISGGGDLDDFRETLVDLGKASRQKVMGIFVSWRGRSLSPFPVGVDYFHRHAAAHRVGGVAGAEALHTLGSAARSANPKNRIIMAGHSLGGAVLESAMAEAIAATVARKHTQGLPLKREDFPADLIVSVNSAESAIYARQLVSTFRNRGIREIEGAPLVVSLTSRTDFVTSLLSPMGNLMGRWVPGINFFNTGVSGTYRRDSVLDPLQGTQGDAHRSTVGHYKPLFSHRYEKIGAEERSLAKVVRDNRAARTESGFVVRGEKEVYRFTPVASPRFNDTPYWVVPIPSSFIRHHQDHWNPNFVGLLTALLSLTS